MDSYPIAIRIARLIASMRSALISPNCSAACLHDSPTGERVTDGLSSVDTVYTPEALEVPAWWWVDRLSLGGPTVVPQAYGPEQR